MRNDFVIVAYYTVNTGYEDEVQNLIHSLKPLKGVNSDVVGVEDLGNWINNTNYKPIFCSQMLKKHRKPIVYVDADAVIQRYPILLDNIEADFACHFFRTELLSGTLYINYSDSAFALVGLWSEYVRKNPYVWEQKNLAKALAQSRADNADFKFRELPATYCQIFDLMKDAGDPVIEHFQASRRLKKV